MSETDTQQQPPPGNSFLPSTYFFLHSHFRFSLSRVCRELRLVKTKFSQRVRFWCDRSDIFNFFILFIKTEKKKGKGKAKAKKQESSETTSNTNNNANTDDNSSSPPPPRLQTPNDIAQSIELRDSLSGKDKTGSSKSKGSGKKKKENTVINK